MEFHFIFQRSFFYNRLELTRKYSKHFFQIPFVIFFFLFNQNIFRLKITHQVQVRHLYFQEFIKILKQLILRILPLHIINKVKGMQT